MTDPRIEIAARAFVKCVRDNTVGDPLESMGWVFGHMEWEGLLEAVDALDAARPEVEGDALRSIAAQMHTSEMDEDRIEHGDFKYAYDRMIEIAKAALTAARATTAPEVEGMTTKTGDGHDTAKYTSTAVLGRVTYISNTAARATAAPDDNALPTDLLPEGVGFSSLIALKEGYGVDLYSLSRKVASQVFSGTGPTPRAAMLAAIKAAGRTEE